jgi:hypothetical protein
MNLGHTTSDSVISQESSSRKLSYVRKFDPAIHVSPSKRAAPDVRPPGSAIAGYNPTGA